MYFKDPEHKAQAVIIWLHGLGASPQDMEGLALELSLSKPVRHVFLAAPQRPVTCNQGYVMPAWYDIVGFGLQARDDLAGIAASTQMLHEVIAQQITEGFHSEQIFLAGFSQGGALALYAGLECFQNLGGLVVLSGYLPAQQQLRCQQDVQIPIFVGAGGLDEVVLPAWTQAAVMKVQEMGYLNVQQQNYPMGHAVCSQEIRDMSAWFNAHIKS